jgi:tripartite-type tricarboxylate transporter receptor subunit TctC
MIAHVLLELGPKGRPMTQTKTTILLQATALLALAAVPAAAQDSYPNQTIKIVVPLGPGPFPDALTRIVAGKLQERWKQPVIVENRPGAANNIGAEAVAKSPPDGYTLLSAPQGPFVIAQHFFRKLGYDPAAFVPITVMASLPYTLVANAKVPYASLHDLIAYAKANPGKVTYASAGIGGQPHLIGELLQYAGGIRMRHVPYKAGLGQAMTDLVGGHVDLMFDNIGNTLPQIKEGKLKVLATLSEARIPQLPDVPAIAETYPTVVTSGWYAIAAPPKTPPEIVAKLASTISETLKLPDVAQRLASYNAVAVGESPAATAAFLKKESEIWRQVIVANGITSD